MTPTEAPATRPTRLGHALAALLYLAVALWAYRDVLPEPGRRAAMPAAMLNRPAALLYQADQRFVIGALARQVHQVLHDPLGLTGYGLCYPLRAPYTLGEHMFAETLLELPFYAATGDPVLSYNLMVVVALWLTGMAMYALALHWTGSVPAALVAGLLFAFHPNKVLNPAHPFVHGNLWTPFALLFTHRLLVTGRWRDALALALFVSLQLLESFYQVLGLAVLGSVYGGVLLVRYRHMLRAVLPKLAVVALLVGIVTWLVFAPYLETRAVWNVLQGRAKTLLFAPRDYLPSGPASPGLLALVLALVGLVDRLRGARPKDGVDPRLLMLVAGLMVFWCTMLPFPLPGLGVRVTSPLVALSAWVPGLDAVRVLRALRFGVYLAVSFLAAYGVLVLVERLPRVARAAVTTLVAAAALWEIFAPASLPPAGRRPATLVAYRVEPSSQDVMLARRVPEGAVLDLPLSYEADGKLVDMPHYVLLAAYHHQPTAACYNSFRTPLQYEVAELAARLPDPKAAQALHALGFRSLIVHRQRLARRGQDLAPLLDDPQHAVQLTTSKDLLLYELRSPHETSQALELIAAPAEATALASATPVVLARPRATLELSFTNRGRTSFRNPTLEPTPLVVRWLDASGEARAVSSARALLPIALAPGASDTIELALDVPASLASGRYTVEVAPESAPDLTLARRPVRLAQAPGVEASEPAGASSSLGLVSP
ncbi:MAG TPA: hypothetical protein VIS07_11695 [Candidatus Binatia bacterium]